LTGPTYNTLAIEMYLAKTKFITLSTRVLL
jgi:hypothetical protein